MNFHRRCFLSDVLYNELLMHAMDSCVHWGDLMFPLQDIRAVVQMVGEDSATVAITLQMSAITRAWFVRNGFKVNGNEVFI